jgi:hypothetical protein
VFREATRLLLGKDELIVREHVELARAARSDLGLVVGLAV